jgi:hypothetical protein
VNVMTARGSVVMISPLKPLYIMYSENSHGGGPGFESPRVHHTIAPTHHSRVTSRRLASTISTPHIGFHISF